MEKEQIRVVESKCSDIIHYKNKQIHREDGPAWYNKGWNGYEGYPSFESWWLNDVFHRDNGPAITDSGGCKEWYVHGKRHRIDGPAVENKEQLGGKKVNQWWINDIQYTEEEFNEQIKLMNS